MDNSTAARASEPSPSSEGTTDTPPTSQSNIARALRYPAVKDETSLAELAKRDLSATLQLLAERTQYITGATGAAIALWEDELMVCRASAGVSAPETGSHLQVNSGLSAESIRLRHILRCDDTENDPRVNRESCRQLGIGSVVVMPLLRDAVPIGVFELFSDRPGAFSERDVAALERMGEMIHTALAHAEAAREVQRAQEQFGKSTAKEVPVSPPQGLPQKEHLEDDSILPVDDSASSRSPKGVIIPIRQKLIADTELPPPILAGELSRIGKCEACGFPISPGRVLCVDCETGRTPLAVQRSMQAAEAASPRISQTPGSPNASPDVPSFLAQYSDHPMESEGWMASHKFLIGGLLLAGTVAILLLLAHIGLVHLPSS
jgi:putative methionine-R-sulfoxide reductase with GAF domain